MVFFLLLAVFLTACTAEQEPVKETSSTETQTEAVTQDYVGLDVEGAQALADKNEVPFRVVMEDGEMKPTTRDFRIGRINATVESGVVTSYEVEGKEESYTADSWKDMIPSTCQSYFDGCNNCNKAEGSEHAACTMKFCDSYEKPECLDNAVNADEAMTAPDNGRKFAYECADENSFTTAYDEYVTGDAIVKLGDDEMMMSDKQDRTAYLFTRVVSASGEKYESEEGRIFWGKGTTATVWANDGDEVALYEDCNIVE